MLALASYLFLIAALLGVLLSAWAIRSGLRWGVLDVPGPRKIHAAPVPLSGGWAIFATLTVVLWGHVAAGAWLGPEGLPGFLPESARHYVRIATEGSVRILPLYAGAALMFALGLIDDLKGMRVRTRLLIQTGLAIGLVLVGIRPSLGFLPEWAACAIGVIWIVGITNAFNFLDGLDGLSAGISLIATLGLLAVMALGSQPNMILLLSALAGAQAGFLRSNSYPARVFLGSSGSLLLGYLQAVCTVQATFMGTSSNWLMPLLIPLFLLAIPIYDTASVVLIRLLQRRPVAIGDQSHFHHRLMRLGFTHLQSVIFIWLIAAAIALSAVRLARADLFESFLVLLQILFVFAILILAERAAYRARQRAQAQRAESDQPAHEPAETRDA